jgi:2-polyprenyl-3-methyl-5-hydroxy-6-metoxy-1,4-benzoquinol methylase
LVIAGRGHWLAEQAPDEMMGAVTAFPRAYAVDGWKLAAAEWHAGQVVVAHWDDVYRRRPADEVSWFQSEPVISLELVQQAGLGPNKSIVDVGGGASVLVDRLVRQGIRDVTVLDVAESALQTSRERLGDSAGRVTWLIQDLLSWQPPRTYDVWHDRAVFHFLTEDGERDRYRATLEAGLAPGGHMVIATFADDGPTYCSGRPVARYSAPRLASEFPFLGVVGSVREEHFTPAGAVQPFTWLLLTRAH